MLEEMMGLESHQEGSDDYVHGLIEIIWVCSCLFADASGYLQVGDCWECADNQAVALPRFWGSATQDLICEQRVLERYRYFPVALPRP